MRRVVTSLGVIHQLSVQVQHAATLVARQRHGFHRELRAQSILRAEEDVADLLRGIELLEDVFTDHHIVLPVQTLAVFHEQLQVLLVERIQHASRLKEAFKRIQ